MRGLILAASLWIAGAAPGAAEPLRALLLDYDLPLEHDVLQSFLCVDPCTRDHGCPEQLIRDGVDFWSAELVVYRPAYLGQSARFVVDAFKDRPVDLLSFSGLHDAGYFGDSGRGQFDVAALDEDLAASPGAESFFAGPSLVLLNGGHPDLGSDGGPVAYLRRLVEEQPGREIEAGPLLAAVTQIGSVRQAYRDLFPNACLAGYRGTPSAESRIGVYRQTDRLLRRIAEHQTGVRRAARAELADRVESECPGGRPCNLCRVDPDYYRPLAAGLTAFLRRQQQRIHAAGEALSERQAAELEAVLGAAAFYPDLGGSCSTYWPDKRPAWPDPIAGSPLGRLLVELLWLDLGSFSPAERTHFEAEVVYRLGGIHFTEIHRIELRVWLHNRDNWRRLTEFLAGPLARLSTFRQQDFLAFLANIECRDCFELALAAEVPSIVRENAAARLVPELGPELYRRALADPDPRVRRRAATRLGAELGQDLLREAASHSDPEVRRVAEKKLE